MRARTFVAAVLCTGGWLAACSSPAPDSAPSTDARQIQLAEPPSAEGAVVSDLEARQAVAPAVVRRAPRVRIVEAPVVSTPHDHMADMALEAPRVTSTMAGATVEAPAVSDLAEAPGAKPIGFGGSIGHGLGSFELPAPAPQTLAGGARAPMILIRGGMGGIDDKCDTRGQHRPGIAINRLSPAFGGYGRGGIR